jgi:hypothetical protein
MFARRTAVFALLIAAIIAPQAVRADDFDGDGVPDENDVCCNTLPGSIVDSAGRPFGDFDGDCDVDLDDYAVFAINLDGPNSCTPELCDNIDNDCNCVIDDVGTVSCGTGACFNTVQVCSNGQPQSCTPLPAGTETCNGIDDNCNGSIDEPFNFQSDPANCGGCGLACQQRPNSAPACQSGSCSATCNAGYANCNLSLNDGCEISTQNDVNNCGNCGLTCPPRANAAPACQGGNCSVICNAGYSNCNGILADGCEVNLQSDVNNCSACGNACPQRPNAVSLCSSSNCSLVCNTGYANCNGNNTDGCEINIKTDANNCNACGFVCQAGRVCMNGACVLP